MSSPTYLNVKQVASRFAVSVPTIWRWAREGFFPRPQKLGPGCSRWRLVDIEAWEKSRVEVAQ